MIEDGSVTLEDDRPVRALSGDDTADVAVLAVKDSSPLPRRIALCPLNAFPSAMDEDQVQTYHCAIHSFPEVLPLCSAEDTGYTSVRETPAS